MTSKGFTLIEMLVALAVFSLLALAASGLLGVSLRNAEVFDRADAATRELQIARSIMRRDFSQVAIRPVRDAYGAPVPAALAGGMGDDEAPILAFVRHGWDNPDGLDGRSSMQYVEYALSGDTLVRRSRPHLDPTPETPVAVKVLFSGVRAAGVSFLSNGQWSERWIAAAPHYALPDAVALDVKLAGAEIRQAFLMGAP